MEKKQSLDGCEVPVSKVAKIDREGTVTKNKSIEDRTNNNNDGLGLSDKETTNRCIDENKTPDVCERTIRIVPSVETKAMIPIEITNENLPTPIVSETNLSNRETGNVNLDDNQSPSKCILPEEKINIGLG